MPFRCFAHDFESIDKAEIEKHMTTLEHTTVGQGACNQCGVETEFTFIGKRSMKKVPAICESCKAKIRAEVTA